MSYRYQTTAVRKILNTFQTNDRTQVLMAPGSGKTVVACRIREAINAQRTIVFIPTIQLLYQQIHAFQRHSKEKFSFLSVTSGKLSKRDKKLIDALKAEHVGTTTCPNEIQSFVPNAMLPLIVFSTYKSASSVIAGCERLTFDLLVFDEAHHIAGSFTKGATKLLHNENLNGTKRLFLTATPRLTAKDDDLNFAGMNDEKLFGPVAYELTFAEAIKRNILTDYELVVVAVPEEELNGIDPSIVVAKKIFEENLGSCGLSFHSTIKRAASFYTEVQPYLDDVFVDTVNSSQSRKHQNGILNTLSSSDKALVSNVRVLGEGFDYTALDFVLMADKKSSTIQIVQNIGRVMRKHEGKDIGRVFIPVVKKADGSVDDEGFREVKKIAVTMAYYDKAIAAVIDQYSVAEITEKRKPIFGEALNKIKVVGLDGAELSELTKQARTRVVVNTKKVRFGYIHETMFPKFIAYVKEHRALPPNEGKTKMLRGYYHSRYYYPDIKIVVDDAVKQYVGQSDAGWEQRINKRLDYCRRHEHLPPAVRDKKSGQKIGAMVDLDGNHYWTYSTIPARIKEQFKDQLENLASYPTKKAYKADREVIRSLETLEQFVEDNGRYPGKGDGSHLYAIVTRLRNPYYKKKHPELAERFKALDKYKKNRGNRANKLTLQETGKTKRELAIEFWNANRDKSWTRKEWIEQLIKTTRASPGGASTMHNNLSKGRWT